MVRGKEIAGERGAGVQGCDGQPEEGEEGEEKVFHFERKTGFSYYVPLINNEAKTQTRNKSQKIKAVSRKAAKAQRKTKIQK